MIHFISEKDFEAKFDKWKKNMIPAEEDLIYSVQNGIENNSKALAIKVIYKNKAGINEELRRIVRDSIDSCLYRDYAAKYKIGPKQPDGTISVSDEWMKI